MRFRNDYRKSVVLSMKVLSAQRNALYENTIKRYSTIFNGLHEFTSDTVRDLYLEMYQMEWLDNHWNLLWEFLTKNKGEYLKDDQKDISLFFAGKFSDFIDAYTAKDERAQAVSMSELLCMKKASLKSMIETADNWEEKSNSLQVDFKKHKEQYQIRIDELKSKK